MHYMSFIFISLIFDSALLGNLQSEPESITAQEFEVGQGISAIVDKNE